jgi:hypothetical protein
MAERFFTASSSPAGNRMFNCALFLSNSNITGFRPESSYFDRSAVSTNRAASSSVLKVGIFFFIAFYFLSLHETYAHQSNNAFAAPRPDCKGQKNGAALCSLVNRSKTRLAF